MLHQWEHLLALILLLPLMVFLTTIIITFYKSKPIVKQSLLDDINVDLCHHFIIGGSFAIILQILKLSGWRAGGEILVACWFHYFIHFTCCLHPMASIVLRSLLIFKNQMLGLDDHVVMTIARVVIIGVSILLCLVMGLVFDEDPMMYGYYTTTCKEECSDVKTIPLVVILVLTAILFCILKVWIHCKDCHDDLSEGRPYFGQAILIDCLFILLSQVMTWIGLKNSSEVYHRTLSSYFWLALLPLYIILSRRHMRRYLFSQFAELFDRVCASLARLLRNKSAVHPM